MGLTKILLEMNKFKVSKDIEDTFVKHYESTMGYMPDREGLFMFIEFFLDISFFDHRDNVNKWENTSFEDDFRQMVSHNSFYKDLEKSFPYNGDMYKWTAIKRNELNRLFQKLGMPAIEDINDSEPTLSHKYGVRGKLKKKLIDASIDRGRDTGDRYSWSKELRGANKFSYIVGSKGGDEVSIYIYHNTGRSLRSAIDLVDISKKYLHIMDDYGHLNQDTPYAQPDILERVNMMIDVKEVLYPITDVHRYSIIIRDYKNGKTFYV